MYDVDQYHTYKMIFEWDTLFSYIFVHHEYFPYGTQPILLLLLLRLLL